jgi:hypothetical protein
MSHVLYVCHGAGFIIVLMSHVPLTLHRSLLASFGLHFVGYHVCKSHYRPGFESRQVSPRYLETPITRSGVGEPVRRQGAGHDIPAKARPAMCDATDAHVRARRG